MNGEGANKLLRRFAAALALSTAPLVAVERANAACTPTAPATIDCTGATTDQNPPNGFGTGTETGVTVNVQLGASVTSTATNAFGIRLSDGTINNLGTVTGGFGLGLTNGGTVFNSGTITATRAVSIISIGSLSVTNSGSVTGVDSGVSVTSGSSSATVTNNGLIQATGTGNAGIAAAGDATVTNAVNSGAQATISGDGFGILAGNAIVTNDGGLIQATGAGSTGIRTNGNATVSNNVNGIFNNIGRIFGTLFGIDATGTGNPRDANVTNNGVIGISAAGATSTTAIHATGTATVGNTGDGISTGVIQGTARGIDAGAVTVETNTGKIEATEVTGIAVRAATDANVTNAGTIRGGFAGIFGQTVTVTSNSGTIESTAANSRAIEAGVGGLTVNNSGTIQSNGLVGVISDANADVTNNGGLIQATGFIGDGIKATGDATVNNKLNGSSIGRIFGTRFGIDATNANVTSTGVIGVDSVGTTSLNAIHASGTATVSNTGDGVSTGVIQGTVSGIDAGTVNVTANTGRIEATGAGGVAIAAGGDADITSAGKIQATGTNGVAIQADGTATVSNAGDGITTGVIQGVSRGIFAETVKVTANTGRIEATAANGIAIRSFGDADITSTGNILAGATAIQADGTAKVGNTGDGLTTGLIQGTLFGINARTVNVTANTGKIAAFAVNGVAVNAQTTATINNLAGSISGGAFGINAPILDVTNAFGATITGGVSAIQGSGTVRNAGTIEGGTSVSFTGAGDNTMILQTGSELIGDAVGSTASTNNNLILQGSGTASNNFRNFNTLDVQAGGTWVWNSNGSGTFGQTTVSSGTFAVDGLLFSPVSVNSGGVLAGRGTITGAVSAAGTIAPGAAAPFSTLTVQGNVDFTSGSIYRVNVGAAGQNDKLQLAGGGAANLSGGTVNVLAPNGFALSTPYTVLTATGGLGGTTFSGVTSSFASAFITPSLTYDANNVFLTLALLNNGGGGGTGFGFAGAAQTPNQIAVATALDAGPQTSSLIAAVLTQAIAGARQAFDALSGEIFGSLHNAQAEVAQFARSGMLGRMRQISYAGLPGELGALGFGGPQLAYASADANAGLPVKAAPNVRETSRDTGRDLTFWAQGLGGWGRTDGDGNAALLSSRFGGFLSGADARFGDTLRAGLVAGYVRSDVDVAARASSAGIDSVQLGAYAAGRLGAFNLRGGASWSFDSIDTSRGIFFPGFTDKAKASFHGNVGQVFGEVGYGMAFNRVAVEPLAGLAYVHLRDGSFLESGGIAALSGSSAKDNIGYSWLGVRAASAVPLANGTVLVPRATLQWQHAFGDVTPNAALAFQATGAAFTVAGIPIARDAALVEAGFEWRFSPSARLGAFYQGELAAHAQTHAVKGAFTWGF